MRTRGFATDLPFYPLPFRTERKSIMFPPEIFAGRYMRDDVIAAFEYADRFTELKQLAHWGLIAKARRRRRSNAMSPTSPAIGPSQASASRRRRSPAA